MTPKHQIPDPPKHLSDESQAWFRDVVGRFELESQHVRLLQLACEAWDRCQQAREAIDREGVTFVDRFDNVRPHPAAAIERDSRIAFARLTRELCLDDSAPDESRPPRNSGRRGSR